MARSRSSTSASPKPWVPEGAAATADDMNSPTITNRATALGVILGSAAYMAPEQAKGKGGRQTGRHLVVRCCLFEMLTGRQIVRGR